MNIKKKYVVKKTSTDDQKVENYLNMMGEKGFSLSFPIKLYYDAGKEKDYYLVIFEKEIATT